MIRILMLMTFLLLSSTFASATSFEEANAYFAEAKYQKAQKAYSQILKEKGNSASLCYNLANSYAQLGKNGMAILYYERALRLAPTHADIHHNLKRIREEAHLFELNALDSFFAAHNVNFWAFSALFSLAIMVLLLVFAKQKLLQRPYRLPSLLGTASLCCIGCIILTILTYQRWPAFIVIQPTDILISPFDGAKISGRIAEGQSVLGKIAHGDFLQIKDNKGHRGWVKVTDIKRI